MEWTPEEIAEFDRLAAMAESRSQMDRISGRLELSAFVKLHGREKCNAMFAELTKPQR